MNRSITVAVIFALVLLYQNCGQNSMSFVNEATKASGLGNEDGQNVELVESDCDPGIENCYDDANEPPVTPPEEEVVEEDDPPQMPPGEEENNEEDVADDDEESEEEVVEQGAMKYICILEGPGKSVHLGLLNGNASEDINTPDAICMSEYACLEIVSTAFNVKSAEKRGFCPDKNPHVVPLTDAEILALIESL